MSEPDELILVHTTCANAEQARSLAARLVERRLAACASVGRPIGSIYPWEGAIQHEQEIPLTLKTTRAAFAALNEALQDLHPYDVPEVLAVPVLTASPEFAGWVRGWLAGAEA